MASLDKRWSDDTGCTRVFIEQVFFFFFWGGGELVGSKFQKLLMKNLKYNEKVAASNLALKRIVDLYFVIHFLYPLYPKQWNVYHLQVKPLHLAVTNVL